MFLNCRNNQIFFTAQFEEAEVSSIPNTTYLQWLKQDQAILSTLVSSLTEGVLAQIIGYSTSREVWQALERSYVAHSRARIVQLRTQLAIIKKGNLSVTEYFNNVKCLSD